MSLADFLHQFSLRLFVCGIFSPADRILFQLVECCWSISDPCTCTWLLRYKLTLCIRSDHFWSDFYISIKIKSGIPLTVFSFACPGKGDLFPFPGDLSVRLALCYVLPYHLGAPSISASVQTFSSLFCLVLYRSSSLTLRVLRFISICLMGLLMPLSCI